MDVGLFSWKYSCHKENSDFLPVHWIQKPDPWTSSKDVLREFWDVFRGENVLVNISQNHRYYSGDLNSSSRIREQEEALFPALAGPRLSFLFLFPFPAAWEVLIRHTSIWGGVTSACWGGIQIVWWSGWLAVFIYFILFSFLNSLVLLWDTSLWSCDDGAIPVFLGTVYDGRD